MNWWSLTGPIFKQGFASFITITEKDRSVIDEAAGVSYLLSAQVILGMIYENCQYRAAGKFDTYESCMCVC